MELKRQIVQTLLPLEERLRAENYAAYMKCEVYRYKKNSEEWHKRQEKRNKTRVSRWGLPRDLLAKKRHRALRRSRLSVVQEIFKSILESPVAEEVPACEEDAALAAADAIKVRCSNAQFRHCTSCFTHRKVKPSSSPCLHSTTKLPASWSSTCQTRRKSKNPRRRRRRQGSSLKTPVRPATRQTRQPLRK